MHAIEHCEDAVSAADIVCITTSAAEPILFGDWIAPGTHLNIVGSSIPSTAEIDGTLVAMSRFFVDFRESAINQAGDYRRAVEAGLIDAGHIIGEIGQAAEGTVPGRLGLDDITLYKSLGIAAQDIAAGQHVLALARRLSRGRTVEFA